MVWLCVGVALYTWRSFMNATSRIDRGIALGYGAAQGALFFTSQFSSFFWGAPTWTLFGLAVAFGGLSSKGEPDDDLAPERRLADVAVAPPVP
jgi:hypothetical protein